MKTRTKILLLLVIGTLSLMGCHKDGPNPEEEYRQRLSAMWTLQKAIVDGTDVTNAFEDLILTIEGETFTIQNPIVPLWPANGSYTLSPDASSDNFKLVRSDGMEMRVVELSSTVLTLEMLYQHNAARVTSVSGKYQFFFVK
jgi:hypothetical protein